jgi:hypothetical protein
MHDPFSGRSWSLLPELVPDHPQDPEEPLGAHRLQTCRPRLEKYTTSKYFIHAEIVGGVVEMSTKYLDEYRVICRQGDMG